MKRLRSFAALLVACFALPANAHTFLDHAEPRVGSVVNASPSEIRLWFTENIEPAFSGVRVLDATGRRVDKGDARVDAAERNVLRLSLPPLPAGAYTVEWRVVSVDTHATKGSFSFQVRM